MDFSERPIAEKIMKDIQGCARDALTALKLAGAGASAAVKIEAADSFIDRWQQGQRPPANVVDPDDVPYLFGSLWGVTMVQSFSWQWTTVVFHKLDDSVGLAVASPDRSAVIYPVRYVTECVNDVGVDCMIALSFNLLSAGKMPEFPPNGYADLLNHTRRIVPRRR